MKLKHFLITVIFVSIILFVGCQSNATSFIDSSSELIRYTGRINFSNNIAPEIYWSGTSIQVKFIGKEFKITKIWLKV